MNSKIIVKIPIDQSHISLKMYKGIGSDNGATPWYTVLLMGSEKQKLKIAFDTGTNHSWVTSNRCITDACLMHQRFDVYFSETYRQITSNCQPQTISFGPWGAMLVSMGQDCILFHDSVSNHDIPVPDYNLYISQEYCGKQFESLIWDGAIGIPSIPDLTDTSELVKVILGQPTFQKVLFFNYKDKEIQFGNFKLKDVLIFDLKKDVPKAYNNLWFVNLNRIQIGNQTLAIPDKKPLENISFCIDTGSSYFKGDPLIINALIAAVTYNGLLPLFVTQNDPKFLAYPTLKLSVKMANGHGFYDLILEPMHYFEKIAEDLYVLAFHPMEGLDNILLTGSEFLEKYNPVFYFDENMNGNSIGLVPI